MAQLEDPSLIPRTHMVALVLGDLTFSVIPGHKEHL